VTVTVSPTAVAGTATAAALSVCSGGTTTLSLTGQTGTIQWQQSADGSTGWANVTGGTGATTASYTTPVLTGTSYYRAVVTSGACTSSSSTVTVTLSLPTAITTQPSTSTQNICQNGSATALSVVATGTVLSYQWYSNTTASNTGSTLIVGADSSSYTPVTTSVSALYYYCVVSGTCGSVTSNISGLITVSPLTVAGTVSASATSICSGNTTTLSLAGYVGVIQWQSSSNNSTWTNITGAFADSFTTPALNAATYYRVVVSSVNCSDAITETINITVNPTPVISGLTSLGIGDSITLSATTTAASLNAWVSSNSAVATVSNSGLVTGLAIGSAIISFTNSNGCIVRQAISVVAGSTQTPVLTSPATNTAGATTLNFNYT
jgi:hypothetical protein